MFTLCVIVRHSYIYAQHTYSLRTDTLKNTHNCILHTLSIRRRRECPTFSIHTQCADAWPDAASTATTQRPPPPCASRAHRPSLEHPKRKHTHKHTPREHIHDMMEAQQHATLDVEREIFANYLRIISMNAHVSSAVWWWLCRFDIAFAGFVHCAGGVLYFLCVYFTL